MFSEVDVVRHDDGAYRAERDVQAVGRHHRDDGAAEQGGTASRPPTRWRNNRHREDERAHEASACGSQVVQAEE